jgi:hypothetical protein
MKTLGIKRAIVVAVAGKPPEPCIAVKAVASRSIADESEKILHTEIVDPRQGCLRRSDNIFSPLIIEISETHAQSSFLL